MVIEGKWELTWFGKVETCLNGSEIRRFVSNSVVYPEFYLNRRMQWNEFVEAIIPLYTESYPRLNKLSSSLDSTSTSSASSSGVSISSD